MRLHRLSVTAFGPFPQAVEVDFDEVCAAGLFLIRGATGSGKTSLLDAICFALFADVPGGRTRRGLASDHAPAGTRPMVVLEFTASGRRFRVERSPEYSRPKKRGDGETKVASKVVLEEWSAGAWASLSNRADEAADVLRDALGMGLAQFAKVVVLPQGDVAAFLRADPEERRSLLERLFDISVFTDVEDWLTDERRRTGAVVESLMASVERHLAQLEGAHGAEDAPAWRSFAAADLPTALADYSAELDAEVVGLLAAADAAVTGLSVASAEVQRLQALAATRARGHRALANQAAAQQRAQEMAELHEQVTRGRAAEAVAGHLAGLVTAEVEERSRLAELERARRAVGADGEAPALQDAVVADLAEQLHSHGQVLTELSHVVQDSARSSTHRDRAVEAVTAAEVAVAACAADRDAALVAAEAGRRRMVELADRAARYGVAERDHHSAGLAVQAASRIAELRAAREAAAPVLLAVKDDVLDAQNALIAVNQRRLDGMAGELAGALCDDAPCPVCGSQEHPAPASVIDPVTSGEVETAEAALVRARDAVDGLSRTDTERRARIAALLEQLGDDAGHPMEALVARREETALALRDATEAVSGLTTAQQALRALETSVEQRTAELARATEGLTAARTRSETATAQLAQQRERLDDLLAQHAGCPCAAADRADGPADVVRQHSALTRAVDALVSATSAHAEAVARRQDCAHAAESAAAERGFADLDAAREAALSSAELARRQRTIEEHDRLLAVATAVLAEDEVIEALASPEPDQESARAAEVAARRAVASAQHAHSTAESRLAVLTSVRTQLAETLARLGPARDRATAVRDLADAVTGIGGGNIYKMRLSSFVLAARLEKVVALANERLRRMDSGRYLLEHSDARVAGGRRSGLDLRILDQWTGRSRETASLSGGESFMVSLALALGLADAVREEAGGFDLGTLFVDEGFGTLDEESLEHVMSVLDGLREGGRAVGVVSHVPDLRTRITHQVVVSKTASGSDVAVRTVA